MADTNAASFSFVHAADLHLDTPFHGVGEVAPYVAATLREASLRAFDTIIDLTIERDANTLHSSPFLGECLAKLQLRDRVRQIPHEQLGTHGPIALLFCFYRSNDHNA